VRCCAFRQYKSHNKTPPPISCAENKKTFWVDLSMCLRYMHSFKPITFQELRSYLTSNPSLSLRFHFRHTPQHRTAPVASFLSIPQASFMQSVTTQALFPRISSSMFYFLRRVSPNRESPFGYGKEWFLFPKGFQKTNTTRTF